MNPVAYPPGASRLYQPRGPALALGRPAWSRCQPLVAEGYASRHRAPHVGGAAWVPAGEGRGGVRRCSRFARRGPLLFPTITRCANRCGVRVSPDVFLFYSPLFIRPPDSRSGERMSSVERGWQGAVCVRCDRADHHSSERSAQRRGDRPTDHRNCGAGKLCPLPSGELWEHDAQPQELGGVTESQPSPTPFSTTKILKNFAKCH